MLIGLRVYYFRAVARGMFHCHRCGGDRPYRQRSGRFWFQILRVPLVPLWRAGEHVLCSICRTAYRVEVLRLPTAAQMLIALPAGLRAAAAVLLSGAEPPAVPVRRRAIETIRRAGEAGYDDAALDADLASAADPAQDSARLLGGLALHLETEAREWFLADVVRIGLADGPLTGQRRQAATAVAAQLGLTAAQAQGVISMTEEGAAA
ncbi:MAG TPA: hypothetical protein VGI64_18740 [Streptosporangiaceae bacterium]|jgi:hypothetical protein